jgi:DNA-binding NarL/FixJ family response regulator
MAKTLIVEDHAPFRQMLKEFLNAHFPSMWIEEEPNGDQLLPRIAAFQPDLVFMDIRLPGENGLSLARKIKTRYPNITVVILTSYDLPEYRQAARDSQADLFVTKDSLTQEFLAQIQSILH